MERASEWLRTGVTWIPRLFALQLFWALQVVAGGVVLGLAPATAVLAAQIRKFLLAPEARLEWSAAWRLWRGEFWMMQLVLGVPLLHGALIALCLWLAQGTVWALPIAILGAVFAVWALHLPAVVVRRADDASAPSLWLVTLTLISSSVWPAAAAVVTAIGVAMAAVYSPAALLAFGASLPALLAGIATARTLRRDRRAAAPRVPRAPWNPTSSR